MTGPQGAESPFASIRELYAAEDRITSAFTAGMAAMKRELLEAIRSSDGEHEATHAAMRATGDERHRLIDAMVLTRRVDDAERRGMVKAGVTLLRGLRLAREFWPVIALVIVALGLATGGFHVTITPDVAP